VIFVGGAQLTEERRESVNNQASSKTISLNSEKIVSSDENASGGLILEPDPAAQNNFLDLDGARRFFKYAQESLVKLVVLSRHFSRHVRVPRVFFDGLASHGGVVGERILDAQKGGLHLLWDAANAHPSETERRRGLPQRCDKQWFAENFCNKVPGGAPAFRLGFFDGVWNSVEQLNVYTPLALMAAMPQLMARVIRGTNVMVRGVTHTLYGGDTGVAETEIIGFKSVLFQALFMGARSNISDFNLIPPPALPLTESGTPLWHFDPHYKALDYLLPPSTTINTAKLRSGTVGRLQTS